MTSLFSNLPCDTQVEDANDTCSLPISCTYSIRNVFNLEHDIWATTHPHRSVEQERSDEHSHSSEEHQLEQVTHWQVAWWDSRLSYILHVTSRTAQDPSEVDQETGNLSIWLCGGAHVEHAQRRTH